MERDCKADFLQRAEIGFSTFLKGQDLEKAADMVAMLLKDYDLTSASRELIPCPMINEKLLKKYCACLSIGGKSDKTIAQYKRTAMKLSEASGKNYTDMGVYDIRMFLAEEKQRGVSNATLENTRANLSAFFQWLLQEDHITKNPLMSISPIKCVQKVRLPFSKVEIDKMRKACKTDKERAIMEVLLSTGVRVSELTGLDVRDINFAEKSIHVRNGKGAKERTVYMDDLARSYLETYLEGRRNESGSVFLNEYKEGLNPGGVRMILKSLGKRAGVSNVHPHRFRRTFATRLADRGMDLQEIKKLLGHSDVNTTLKYVYTSEEQMHASYLKYSA